MDDYAERLGLLYLLSRYTEKGIRLFLSGRPASPEHTANAVMEEGTYMADYVRNEAGELTEIRYDKVFNG